MGKFYGQKLFSFSKSYLLLQCVFIKTLEITDDFNKFTYFYLVIVTIRHYQSITHIITKKNYGRQIHPFTKHTTTNKPLKSNGIAKRKIYKNSQVKF